MNELDSLLPPHGGYRNLVSFKVARLVYDVTVRHLKTKVASVEECSEFAQKEEGQVFRLYMSIPSIKSIPFFNQHNFNIDPTIPPLITI